MIDTRMAVEELGQSASFAHQDHICHIYQGSGGQLAAAVPFLKEGLDHRECCVYVVDDVEPERLTAELKSAGVDVEAARASGALVLLEGAGFGMGDAQIDEWLIGLGDTVAQAEQAGFSGMRIAVDMTWSLTTGTNLSLVQQMESMANDVFYRERPVIGMCQYNRDRFAPDVLAGALSSHPMAVVDGLVYRNLHYRPPRVLFGNLTDAERVEWMLDELKRQRHEQLEHDELVRAQAAAQAREQLLATAAHELRTPVTSVRGFVQLALRQLADGGSPNVAQLRDMMTVVDRQVERLTRLVMGLFDVSRIETGKLVLDVQQNDIAALLREAVRAAELTAVGRQFIVHAPPHVVVPVDDLRFSRVLTNLLDNAIKYSPNGPIEAAIELAPGGVHVRVRDHGPGVAEEHRAALFDPFYQAEEQSRSGLGLGLYLSRQIVEAHGGRLTAEFPLDGGACFVIWLPAQVEWDGAAPASIAHR